MLQNNKSIFIFIFLSMVITNIFMIASLAFTLHTSRERQEAEARTTVENMALLLDKSVTGTFKEIDLSLHEIQEDLEKELRKKGQLSTNEVNAFVEKREKWIHSIAKIRITDAHGQVQFGHATTQNLAIHYRDQDFFIAAQDNPTDQLRVSKLIQDQTTPGWVHIFSRRYNHPDGTFAGIITATLPASYFNTLISGVDVGAKGIVIVQDLDLRVIARHPTLRTPNGQAGFVGGAPELRQLIQSGAQTGTIYTRQTTDNVPRMGNFRRLSSMPIFVAVALGEKDYLAQWYDDLIEAVLLALLFLLITATASWFLWRQIKASVLANHRSQMLLRNAYDGIHILDLQGHLLEASDSFFKMIGHCPEEVIGKLPSYWDKGYNQEAVQECLAASIDTPEGMRFETLYRNAKGENYPVEVISILVDIDHYQVIFCSARDMTERKKAEEDQRIAATAFEAQVGMLITDSNLVILRANRAVSEITGYSQQELIGQTPRILQSGTHDKNFYTAMWEHIHSNGSWQGELWNRRKNGEVYAQHISIASVRNQQGQISHYVATITDISAYKESEEKVRFLAFHDSLTRLPNRTLFLERLEYSMQNAVKQQDRGAVICVDLDHFKVLNDTQGHETGDHLLQQVATRLTECVGAHHMVARLASDTFVILLDQLGSIETKAVHQAEALAKRILYALSQPYVFETLEYRSSASIGISLFGMLPSEKVEDPIKQADMAMSEAKTMGRNTFRFFDPKIQSQVQERADLDAGLRQALEKNQLILYYQPQVDVAKQVIGVEALLRWQHPTQGMISPARFIPVAEENGFIIPLGYWVLENACRQLTEWAKHVRTAHLSIAVNVSASQFIQDDFVQKVLDILQHTGAPAHLLKLELTESVLAMRVEDIIQKMTQLKSYGITFSLDDFGTGYSSLAYLKRIPIDQLKIDQSFVRDILLSNNDAEISKMIILLAKTLGISVLAEGVETEKQRSMLQEQGCYFYQGYLFAKPMSIVDFEEYLEF